MSRDEHVNVIQSLPKIIEDCSITTDEYSVNYTFVDCPESSDSSSTVSYSVNAIVDIKNNLTGAGVRQPITLLEIPKMTEQGCKIDGTFYNIIGVSRRAPGWYIKEEVKKGKLIIKLEFIPTRGVNLTVTNNYGEMALSIGKSAKSRINIGVFLKALTGKNLKEIGLKLGIKNSFVMSTLIEEPSRDECVSRVLKCLVLNYSSIPGEYQFKELMRRFYDSKFMDCEDARARTLTNISFSSRALHKELARDLTYSIDGAEKTISKNTMLDSKLLEEIDSSGVDTLHVRYNSKIFELKKYKLPETGFSEEELFTMFNMYACALAGYPSENKSYELNNRRTITFKKSITGEIQGRLFEINEKVSSQFFNFGETADVTSIQPLKFDIYSYINSLKSDNNQSESADTTNWLAIISKNSKITSDYTGIANDEMTSVKDSEIGFHDSYVQPEGDKVGLIHSTTLTSRIDDSGVHESPCIKLKDGQPVSLEPVYLDSTAKINSFVAPWDEDCSKSRVKCYYNGRIVTKDRKDVEYQEYSSLNNFSMQTAVIPFIENSSGKRVTMGGNHGRQAQITLKTSRNLVSTGVVGAMSQNELITAKKILEKHYTSHTNIIDCSFEEFTGKKIKLITSDMSRVGTRKLIFSVDGYSNNLEYTIPYCSKTTSNSVNQYNIKSQTNYEYSGNDIVAYPNSFDIDKYDLDYHVDYGYNTPADLDVFDVDLALGNTYKIGFKTYTSKNMDDSMVLSGGILGTNKMSRIMLNEIKYTKKKYSEESEEFRLTSPDVNFEDNGLPRIGTIVRPKEIIIHKCIIKDGEIITKPLRLDAVTEGVVIQASISGDDALVTIASIKEIQVGDKLTGNHGNKGVIGKIVPESYMPFTEDGVPLDITLNPLGLPSRMNISQLLEGLTGYAMVKESAESGKRKAVVISPQNPKSLDIVRDYINKNNIKPEYLRDGRTGRKFPRPTTVAYLYMKALSHTAESMFNTTGLTSDVNPMTLQPKKGKKVEGGQTLGEMEQWALAACNMKHVMQEQSSIQSDDILSKKSLINYAKNGDSKSLKGMNNHNDTYLQVICRSLGSNLTNDEKGNYIAEFMTDKDICSLAKKPLENNRSELHVNEIFGSIQTPALIAESKCKWGYLDLRCEIVHPNWIYNGKLSKFIIVTVLESNDGSISKKVTPLTSDAIKPMVEGKAFIAIIGYTVFYTKDSSIDGYDWVSGIEGVVNAFKTISFEKAKVFYTKIRDNANNKDRFDASEMLSSISHFEKRGMTPKDFVISHFPVMPQAFRIPPGDRSSDADVYYNLIMSAIENRDTNRATEVYKKICGFIGVDSKSGVSKDKKTRNLKEMFSDKEGMRKTIMSKVLMMSSRSVIVPAEAGVIRLGQVGFPFSAAVEQMGIFIRPIIQKAYPILENKSAASRSFMDNFMVAIVNQDIKVIQDSLDLTDSVTAETAYKDIRNLIKEFMLTRAENIGRQPTLHRYGLRTCIPKIVYTKAMEIHPLLGAGYNCDYDGDQMHAEALISEESIREGKEKMSPSTDLINPKDGSFILEPVQDIILGCYLATMIHENKLSVEGDERYTMENVVCYNSLDLLRADLDFRIIEYQDLVSYKHTNGNFYLSTAGRIMFNSTFRGGFTSDKHRNSLRLDFLNAESYCDLKFDGLIKKKGPDYEDTISKLDKSLLTKSSSFTNQLDKDNESLDDKKGKKNSEDLVIFKMSDVTKFICDTSKDGLRVCEAVDEIFIFGVRACDRSGITLGLDDFIEHDEIDDLIRKSSRVIDKVHEHNSIGLLRDEDRKETSIKVYNYVTNYIEKTLMGKYPRNNNLFIIIDSGARGNVSQLMQTCGLIGIVKKNNKENLETPILSNYLRGVSSSDQNMISYGTRNGFSTVKKDTAKAGELTRASVYTLSNFKIVEADCGSENKDYNVEYSSLVLSCKFNGKDMDISRLLDKKISTEDENYEKLFSIGGPSITSKSLYYIKKHNLGVIQLVDGEVQIGYQLTQMFSDLMLNRVSQDLPFLAGGIKGSTVTTGVITKNTLKFIEENRLRTIKVRTMLSCESDGGVCAKCYGVKLDTKKYPNIGEMIGITASQATGESATQANMDQLNNGGKGSDQSVVEIYKQLCKGSVPSEVPKALISTRSGFVTVTDAGRNESTITFKDPRHSIIVDKSTLLVKDGEYVEMGERMTDGLLRANDIVKDTLDETIRARQLGLLGVFNKLFSEGGVYINIRNFECLVKAQTSLVRVYKSSNPEAPEGSVQFLSKLQRLNDDSIEFYTQIESDTTVMNMYGSFLTNFSYSNMFETIAKTTIVPWKQDSQNISFLGKLAVGENIVSGTKKILTQPGYRNVDTLKDKEIQNDYVKFIDVEVIRDVQEVKISKPMSTDLLADLLSSSAFLGSNDADVEESVAVDSDDLIKPVVKESESFPDFEDFDFDEDFGYSKDEVKIPEIAETSDNNLLGSSNSFTQK